MCTLPASIQQDVLRAPQVRRCPREGSPGHPLSAERSVVAADIGMSRLTLHGRRSRNAELSLRTHTTVQCVHLSSGRKTPSSQSSLLHFESAFRRFRRNASCRRKTAVPGSGMRGTPASRVRIWATREDVQWEPPRSRGSCALSFQPNEGACRRQCRALQRR